VKAEALVAKPAPVKAEAPVAKSAPVKAEAPIAKPAPVKAEAPVAKPAPVKAEAPVKRTATYNIIVASVTAESDVQTAIDGFATKGYPGAYLIKGGGRFRIALKGYSTETEAYAKVNELKQNALFKDAWVLKTRN